MEEKPNITILTPVYGRHKFLTLWLYNIKNQTYDHDKLTVIIDECKSDEPFINNVDNIRHLLHPIKIIHNVYNNRSTIGFKRNRLVKNCTTTHFQFFDSDDYYLPTCIDYNLQCMIDNKVGCVGSDQMAFCFLNEDYKMTGICCGNKLSHIHEATLFATKRWFKTSNKFLKTKTGEGARLFEGQTTKNVFISDVMRVMLCLCHEGNTINKDRFKDPANGKVAKLKPELQHFLYTLGLSKCIPDNIVPNEIHNT